jgi:hypothetical protein
MSTALDEAPIVKPGDIVSFKDAAGHGPAPALVLGFRDGLARFPLVAWSPTSYTGIALEDISAVVGNVFDLTWPKGKPKQEGEVK